MRALKTIWSKYRLYILIVLVLCIVRFSPYSCGIPMLDEALNDFAVGGIASAIVALLIFIQDENKIKKKNESLKLVIIHPFANAILDYMQQFCFTCSFMPATDRSRRALFLEWNDEYCKKYKNCNDSETFTPMEVEYLLSKQQNIVEIGQNILNQKIWLSNENIMTKEDFDIIYKIICNFALNEMLLSGECHISNLHLMNTKLDKLLKSNTIYKGFTECKHSHDIRLSSYLVSTDTAEY